MQAVGKSSLDFVVTSGHGVGRLIYKVFRNSRQIIYPF